MPDLIGCMALLHFSGGGVWPGPKTARQKKPNQKLSKTSSETESTDRNCLKLSETVRNLKKVYKLSDSKNRVVPFCCASMFTILEGKFCFSIYWP